MSPTHQTISLPCLRAAFRLSSVVSRDRVARLSQESGYARLIKRFLDDRLQNYNPLIFPPVFHAYMLCVELFKLGFSVPNPIQSLLVHYMQSDRSQRYSGMTQLRCSWWLICWCRCHLISPALSLLHEYSNCMEMWLGQCLFDPSCRIILQFTRSNYDL